VRGAASQRGVNARAGRRRLQVQEYVPELISTASTQPPGEHYRTLIPMLVRRSILDPRVSKIARNLATTRAPRCQSTRTSVFIELLTPSSPQNYAGLDLCMFRHQSTLLDYTVAWGAGAAQPVQRGKSRRLNPSTNHVAQGVFVCKIPL